MAGARLLPVDLGRLKEESDILGNGVSVQIIGCQDDSTFPRLRADAKRSQRRRDRAATMSYGMALESGALAVLRDAFDFIRMIEQVSYLFHAFVY